METFGARLRTEREGRGLTIQAVAEALGVDNDSLLALERNDFAALPDEPVMMRCLKGYAKCLEVDSELMIADFLQEREGHLALHGDPVPDAAAETAPEMVVLDEVVTDEPRPQRFPYTGVAVATVALVAIAGAWWVFSGDPSPARPERSSEIAPIASAPTETAPAPSETVEARPRAEEPAAPPTRAEAPRPVQATPIAAWPSQAIRIGEYGVGTAVKKRSLVGESDRFAAGTQVWFWTRVEGGTAGDRIDHVWLRGGEEVARISLKIGGSPWRTHSAKTLRGDSSLPWAVEARDPRGRVLARSEFSSVP